MRVTYGQGFNLAKTMLAKVEALEVELLKMPQAAIVTEHKFFPGVYERTITIPPWTVLTGAEHRTGYTVRLEKGTIAVNTDDGVKVLTAPCEFKAPAGVKRVGRVFEDEVVWTDVYQNEDNCTDIPTIEERLYVVPSVGLGENRVNQQIESNRADFALFLEQMGMSQEEMDAVVQVESDLMPMPHGVGVEIRKSMIHGDGLFATRRFKLGEVVCPGRIDGKRTPGGRFINHSISPNVKPVKQGDNIFAVAIADIQENEEITVDYRASMLVNFGIDIKGEMPCLVG